MVALTADITLKQETDGDFNEIPVAAAKKIFRGSMVGLDVLGNAQALVAGDRFMGHSTALSDNTISGALAGDKVNRVLSGRYRLEVDLTNTLAEVGRKVYATDDNGLTLLRSLALLTSEVGRVIRFVSATVAIVEFSTWNLNVPFVAELDVQTGEDTADHILVPAWMNQHGFVQERAYALITEVMVGSSEDQGIITVFDEDDNSMSIITAADAAADAAGDLIIGTNDLLNAASGIPAITVAAGKAIDCKVTQATSGGSPAGKMKVYLQLRDLI